MANQQKLEKVKSLSDLLQKQTNFALVQFFGTKHQKLEELRKNLKKANTQFKVLKNTLFEKAINKLSNTSAFLTELRKKILPLKNNTALLTFDKDWSKAMNAFTAFMKEEKTLSFKSGVLDNQIYDAATLMRIGNLPPKEELAAKLIGSLKSPMNSLVYNLRFNMQKLVLVLKAKAR